MLNDRMARFVAAYTAGADAGEAAVAAGYSPGRARRQATELLRRADIAEALAAARCEAPAAVDQARVVRELARIAFADPVDLLEGAEASLSPAEARQRMGGTGLKLKYTPRRGAGAEGETAFELSMEREVRVGDKLRALELLTKLLGLAAGPEDAEGGVVILPEVEEDG